MTPQLREAIRYWEPRRIWYNLGTLFALLFATYWIADEIYPYV